VIESDFSAIFDENLSIDQAAIDEPKSSECSS